MTRALLALLPPSETKRDSSPDGGSAAFPGGSGSDAGASPSPGASSRPLAESVGHPLQAAARAEAIAELARLAADPAAHAAALKLSAAQAERELARNASLETQARMPAIERYTGVLYDHLDPGSLDERSRAWLARSVRIQSALLGIVGAEDGIPAYRCSSSTRLGRRSMTARWAGSGAAALAEHEGPILDLRSKTYAALAPLPDRDDAIVAEVATRMPDGELKALNHFNKRGKGELVRTLAQAPDAVRDALDAARGAESLAAALRLVGAEAEAAGERELLLIVDDPRGGAR